MTPFLLRYADDLYLHGHDLVRWITDYVDLEESLAVGSMTQEELSHAAALLAATGADVVDRDTRYFVRPVEEWAPPQLLCEPATTWPDTVVRSLLFSEATAALVDRLRRVEDDAVRATAEVIAAEQSLHVRHWHRWLRILVRDRRTGDDLLAALHSRAAMCADLFSPAPGDPGQPAEPSTDVTSVEFDLAAVRSDWVKRVHAVTVAAGAGEITLPEPVPCRTWLTADSMTAETIEQLRSIRIDHPERRYEIYR
jgi:1,2-phenylacetyl-CoA epoxidase catalytic subunit